ncbi:MAG: NifB/NifX family molybdenum-iron cluster-binding protein [Armatimonadota bacterium]
MKVAVCSSGTTLDAPMDPSFGRCPYFVIVDVDTMECTAEPNPGAQVGQGAGVAAAQVLSAAGVNAVLAGKIGPDAFQLLGAAGVSVYMCVASTVKDAVDQFKSGALTDVNSATVGSHLGTANPGSGSGAGHGGRPGMGRGRGRCRGG